MNREEDNKRQNRLNREFYNIDSLIVAREILGKVLVHEMYGQEISAKIVETEAYMGIGGQSRPFLWGKKNIESGSHVWRSGVFLCIFYLRNALLL